jgi:hypothetical protein
MGVPAVSIGTDMFEITMKEAAKAKGYPYLRMSFLEQPTSGQPEELVLEKIHGDDPVSGKPFLQQLYDQLTQPLTEEESYTGWVDPEIPPRLLEPDTAENLQKLFITNAWTEGLPIVLPTEERVAAMIAGSNRQPDEVVGNLSCNSVFPPWSFTVEQVAVNAVMAGAEPKDFPIILGIAASGEPVLFSSTTSQARMVLVNGPIAREVGMNGGLGAFGPWNRANSVIGRAALFISKNLGNGILGITYMGSQGNTQNYNSATVCENEGMLDIIGWDPFHVEKGFAINQSVVTIFWGLQFRSTERDGWQPLGYQTGPGAQFAAAAEMAQLAGPSYYPFSTLVLDPLVAENLARTFETKQEFTEWLVQNTYLNQSEFFRAYPSYRARALAGEEPYASWYALPRDHRVPVLKYTLENGYGEPEVRYFPPGLNVIVVGGGSNAFWMNGDFFRAVSISVDQFRPETPWAPIQPPEYEGSAIEGY